MITVVPALVPPPNASRHLLPYTCSCLLEVYVHVWPEVAPQSDNCTWVPLFWDESGTSMHRPDWLPTSRPSPLPGGAVVGGELDGPVPVGPGVAAFRALRTEVYAAFLLPPPSNNSGLSLDRHESLSRTPHTVMPIHRGTLTHAWVR